MKRELEYPLLEYYTHKPSGELAFLILPLRIKKQLSFELRITVFHFFRNTVKPLLKNHVNTFSLIKLTKCFIYR